MLLCSAATGSDQVRALKTAAIVAAHCEDKGYRPAFVVPRESYEEARRLVGKAARIFRLPEGDEARCERLLHLRKSFKHNILYLDYPTLAGEFLSRLQHAFEFTLVYGHDPGWFICADLIVLPLPRPSDRPISCLPGAKLLLGPKYYIGSPFRKPPAEPNAVIDQVFLDIGSRETDLFAFLEAVALLANPPQIFIQRDADNDVRRRLAAFRIRKPSMTIIDLVEGGNLSQDIDLWIRRPGFSCLENIHAGQFLLTAAVEKDQLELSYLFESQGLAPSLGWWTNLPPSKIAQQLGSLFNDPLLRYRYTRHNLDLMDGLVLEKLVRFMPIEKSLDENENPSFPG